ncbi:MAG: membrane protein insertase YidC [bacterium]|nr:membrane protein insertase YidC [bacterium]
MTQETRNLIIATLAMVLIFAGWHYFYEMPRQEELKVVIAKEQVRQAEERAVVDQSQVSMPAATVGGEALGLQSHVPSVENPTLTREDILGNDPRVSFSTSHLTASLRLRGGRLDDLVLSQYRKSLEEGSPSVTLLSPAQSEKPYYMDFGWLAPDKSLALPGVQSLWTGTTHTDGKGATLTWNNGQGLTFSRSIEDAGEYLLRVTQEVSNQSGQTVVLYPYNLMARTGHAPNDTMMTYEGPLGYFNEKLHEETYEDLEEKGVVTYKTSGGWFGVTDKYWFTALIPDQNSDIKATFQHLKTSKNLNQYQIDTVGSAQTLAPGATLKITSHVFAGAKIVSLLDQYEEELGIKHFDLATDFGWLHFISKPLFYVLQYFNDVLGSFALAILLLTVIVKILFFPLANKSYRSMAKMKALSPQMEKIKARYGDDKVKMQQEIMALYKKSKVNPASGCLPMLLQLPIFFALYKVLIVSIEMRQAPFYGWISDLSVPDPLNIFTLFGLIPWDPPSFLVLGIWPLIMGGTMLLQQKLNPPPSDPAQAKAFMFMPIIFTFLFARFPAGLVIYWTWSNILSIAQQWFIMRTTTVTKK